jgi:hypothetical protein
MPFCYRVVCNLLSILSQEILYVNILERNSCFFYLLLSSLYPLVPLCEFFMISDE